MVRMERVRKTGKSCPPVHSLIKTQDTGREITTQMIQRVMPLVQTFYSDVQEYLFSRTERV